MFSPEWIALYLAIATSAASLLAYLARRNTIQQRERFTRAAAAAERRAKIDANFEAINAAIERQTAAIVKNGQDLREHMGVEGPVVAKMGQDIAEIKGHLGLKGAKR